MSLLPLVLDPQKYRNTEIQSNLKLSQDSDVTHQNQQEKNIKPLEKELGQPNFTSFKKNTKKHPKYQFGRLGFLNPSLT